MKRLCLTLILLITIYCSFGFIERYSEFASYTDVFRQHTVDRIVTYDSIITYQDTVYFRYQEPIYGDKVFYMFNSGNAIRCKFGSFKAPSHYLVYDYNLQVMDTFQLSVGVDSGLYFVQSIDTVLGTGNQEIKRLKILPINRLTNDDTDGIFWLENLGSEQGLLYLFHMRNHRLNSATGIHCQYADSVLANGKSSCHPHLRDYTTSIETTTQAINFQVTNNQVLLPTGHYSVHFMDLLGRSIQVSTSRSEAVDIPAELGHGFVVVVNMETGALATKQLAQ